MLPDRTKSVIQRAGFREVPLFDDRGHFIEIINRALHRHPRNTRQKEVEVIIEQFKRLEQIADGTVFPEKRVTGCVECQRDDEIPQRSVKPVIPAYPFLKVLPG